MDRLQAHRAYPRQRRRLLGQRSAARRSAKDGRPAGARRHLAVAATNTAHSIANCTAMLPAGGSTNCGRNAMLNIAVLGLSQVGEQSAQVVVVGWRLLMRTASLAKRVDAQGDQHERADGAHPGSVLGAAWAIAASPIRRRARLRPSPCPARPRSLRGPRRKARTRGRTACLGRASPRARWRPLGTERTASRSWLHGTSKRGDQRLPPRAGCLTKCSNARVHLASLIELDCDD